MCCRACVRSPSLKLVAAAAAAAALIARSGKKGVLANRKVLDPHANPAPRAH